MRYVVILGLVFSCLLSRLSPVDAHPVGLGFLDQRMVGNPSRVGPGGVPGCSQEIHDLYVTTGPDGLPYRTWHALWHPRVRGELLRQMPTWKELRATKRTMFFWAQLCTTHRAGLPDGELRANRGRHSG